jgi:hypothetical protein
MRRAYNFQDQNFSEGALKMLHLVAKFSSTVTKILKETMATALHYREFLPQCADSPPPTPSNRSE